MADTDDLTTASARRALDRGDPRTALNCLRWQFRAPDLPGNPVALAEAAAVLAALCLSFQDEDLGALARRVSERPSDVDALYQLGFALIDRQLHEIAAGVLERAHALAPDDPELLSELVGALEGEGRNDRAVAVLRECRQLLAQHFVCRYLLAFNTIMVGDLAAARSLLPDLRPADDQGRFMNRRLESMLRRADAIAGVASLDRQDLRGWHFVTTGGILLHLSPYGFDEGMNGRYAYTQDGESRIHQGLGRLHHAVEALALRPPRVLHTGDRESRALGLAVARLHGLPLEPLDAGPGLVVTYDLAGVAPEALRLLATRRDGQSLFAHAACWTAPPPFVPDFATFLYQTNAAPWSEHLTLDPETKGAKTTPADDSPAEVLAERIVTADPFTDELARRDHDEDLARFLAAARPTLDLLATGERRSPFWVGGGPVKSSRFA